MCCLDFTALRFLFFIDVLIIREFSSSSRNNNNIIINCICFNFLRCIIFFTTIIKFNKTIKSFLFFAFKVYDFILLVNILCSLGKSKWLHQRKSFPKVLGIVGCGGVFKCRCRVLFILLLCQMTLYH